MEEEIFSFLRLKKLSEEKKWKKQEQTRRKFTNFTLDNIFPRSDRRANNFIKEKVFAESFSLNPGGREAFYIAPWGVAEAAKSLPRSHLSTSKLNI